MVIAALVLLLSVAACSNGTDPGSRSSTDSGGATAPRVGELSGDMNDWISVVCSGRTATQENNLNALGDGICHQDYSKPDGLSNLKAVLYTRFESEASMLRTLSIVKPSYYAAGQSGGVFTAFYVMSDTYAEELLWPLQKFGFEINPGPQSAKATRTVPSQRPSTRSAVPVPTPAQAPSSPATAVAPDSGLQWRFTSRTGNIACDLNGSVTPAEVTCEVRAHSYQPQVKPHCNPGWANSFRLVQGRTVEVNCYSGTDFRSTMPVQEYGRPLTVGSLTCVLDETTGVTCKDSTTGHFFRAARQAYEWR